MRIFIAGATGTLGIPLVKAMVSRGHDVTGLTRNENKKRLLADMGARVAIADALDRSALTHAVRKAHPELVIHLLTAIPKAGPLSAADMAATDHLRIKGTDNLLHAAAAAGTKRIIAESMVLAYGYGYHGPGKLTENDTLQPREEYAPVQSTVNALRYLEETVLAAGRKGQIEAIALRFGLLYGAQVPATRSTLGMVRSRKIPVLSSGDGPKSWIHLDDAVAAIIAAADRGRAGEIYNIVDDEPAGYRDLIEFGAKIMGAPRPYSIPLWLMRLRSQYSAVFLSTRLVVSNEKAKNELGWSLRFPNYRAGLREIASDLLEMKAA